jgi:aspartate/glutamate racemase
LFTHADLGAVGDYLQTNNLAGLAGYLAAHIERQARAGAQLSMIAAVAPHACAEKLRALSPLPLIDLAEATLGAVLQAQKS